MSEGLPRRALVFVARSGESWRIEDHVGPAPEVVLLSAAVYVPHEAQPDPRRQLVYREAGSVMHCFADEDCP